MSTTQALHDLAPVLEAFIHQNDGCAGTLHLLSEPGRLQLACSVNIPPPVIKAVQEVPSGKGMAGLALERKAPVSTCNLQTDNSGDVRPGARAVSAQAAVALPIFDHSAHTTANDGDVTAIVGIAFQGERELSEVEVADLQSRAQSLFVLPVAE